ncbi:phospholipase A1-like [Hyposmocoma kahamanoa]|uniref:phospholipase A1-like n=1 Tax=Hyposmocoma kahamanoa TaxID=1477025 RepID=UPI000E6D8414|nr:phospholipase A1-like [Hyposmocoma kahamanoa]XP_026315703.1 phospholipase A1-like [Hyposmocoma kahamanoa]
MCIVKKMFWIFLISFGVFHHADAATLRCYKGSLDNYIEMPLNDALPLASSICIDQTLPTVFYTFGYRGRAGGPATTAMISAYLKTRKRNVILLDWEDEAKSGLLGIPLGYVLHAVPNAKRMGDEMGKALVQLARAGLNMTQVHLLGHSLGAHLMAYAGKRARANGFVVSRITGLDPARALFEGSFAVQSGLDRTCAKFVDIIHSDPGGYGTSQPAGTVDIWPNFAGTGVSQPGCPEGSFEMFSSDDLCSHDRSWRYFVEALSTPTSFMAAAAPGYNNWISRDFRITDTIFLGDLTSTRARGSYYLTTESKSPYGKGQSGILADNRVRRRRTPTSSFTRWLRYLR